MVFLAILTAVFLAANWLLLTLNLDNRVARFRRASGRSAQLSLERGLWMPWDETAWLFSGIAVCIIFVVGATLSFWLLVVMFLLLFGYVGTLAIQDLPRLQQEEQYFQSHTNLCFVILNGPTAGHIFHLRPTGFLIGREKNNDLVIADPTVSRRQAQVTLEHGHYVIKNLSKSAEVYINGELIHSPRVLRKGDRVDLGSTSLKLTTPEKVVRIGIRPENDTSPPVYQVFHTTAKLEKISGPLKQPVFHLYQDEVTLGRAQTNYVVIDDETVSRHHARICLAQGRWYLQDQSTYGTYVNGKKVNAVALEHNDRIRIGPAEIRFLEKVT